MKRKLSKDLIAVIAKSYAKILKRKKQMSNGHPDENTQDEDSNDELVIDNDDEIKPEYFKYFENKCKEPCYVPEKLLYAKPDKGENNKITKIPFKSKKI